MEDILVAREAIIGKYLLKGYPTGEIAWEMDLAKRLVDAYILHMQEQFHAANTEMLIQMLKEQAARAAKNA